MRTGEVEKLTEVKEANIKFYEREGLINPRRNENGYRDFSDEDIDKRFILKGVAFTTAFAVCVKFTVMVLTMGGFSQQDTQQDTVFCFFGGMLAILCGFVYIFAEALTKQDFLYAWGKNWGGSGMGGLANSYSILGIGVGLAGTTWPLWGGLLIACIALSAIIRMVLMHVIKEVLHFFLGDFNKRTNLHRSATA